MLSCKEKAFAEADYYKENWGGTLGSCFDNVMLMKKRYGLCVLNYIATSNHIHMLVLDTGEAVIPQSLQLIAGRTAQEYNICKKRKGAFWDDRYHATAVQPDEHLGQCLVSIYLNMIRAGVKRFRLADK